MKNVAQWEFAFRKVSDNNLQGTHFHAFYPHASLLMSRSILNYIILIFFLDCFIALFLRFYILQ